MAAQSGIYGEQLLKAFKGTLPDIESTNVMCLMVEDTVAPDFDTHVDTSDITSEVTAGNGYTAGGKALDATPSLSTATPASGQVNYDSANVAWASSTITDAMAAVLWYDDASDYLIMMSDFGTAASTSNGTFTIQVDTNGWFYFDHD